MGYIVLAAGVVALGLGGEPARVLAIDGAVVQMVSHGLITGALFPAGRVDLPPAPAPSTSPGSAGLAGTVPVLTGAFGVAAFASLGLPGLSGFIAEFQIFVGVFGAEPVLAAIALPGRPGHGGALPVDRCRGSSWAICRSAGRACATSPGTNAPALFPMLALVVAIGLMPSIVLDVIVPFGPEPSDRRSPPTSP